MAAWTMNKGVGLWTFAVAAAGIVGWLSIHEVDDTPRPNPAASSSASAAAAGGGDAFDLDAGVPLEPDEDGGIDEDIAFGLDAGFELPDGGDEVPELDDAPKSIRFGVVMVTYKGAQGAPEDARSREEAKKLADELAALARDDFAAAVKKGDKGSVEDAGKIFRGIMEPAPDYELFRLEKDQVSDPFDTPRGFWVAKRLK